MSPKQKAKSRKPAEKELQKIDKRFGWEIAGAAMRHYITVKAAEKRTSKRIAELQKELEKLKK